jgi:spore coat polysaccharide biosynthesis predicted glycosyltransferase SpsG/ribosomal protein S18 acetylase RimI-like enzyme
MRQATVILDAGPQIGFGHISRSFSLIRALKQRAVTVTIISPAVQCHWFDVLEREGVKRVTIATPVAFEKVEPHDLLPICQGLHDDLVLVDHYRVTSDALRSLVEAHRSVWRIDDQQGVSSGTENLVSPLPPLASAPDSQHLLGPQFAFVDSGYLMRRPSVRIRTAVNRILISFGGSDPANLTAPTLASVLSSDAPFDVDVVIGPGYAGRSELEAVLRRNPTAVTIHEAPANLVDLIARADLAIGSPGHTSWERCSLGLPALLITQAANQTAVGSFMHSMGAARLLGAHPDDVSGPLAENLIDLAENPAALREMSMRAYRLVDAQGPSRVADHMLGLQLRPAQVEDAQLIYDWVTDPAVRSQSLQREAIEWGAHQEWLRAMIADGERLLMIAELDGKPLGQCRFDSDEAGVRISFLVSPEFRGCGLARPMLNAAILTNGLPGVMRAEVRAENVPSLAVFRGLMFTEAPPDDAGIVRFTSAQDLP